MFLLNFLLLVAATAPEASISLNWTPFTYVGGDSPRSKVSVEGEQARLRVPEDHDAGKGPFVDLFLMRLRSTSSRPGAPILYLHGGPGGSSLEHLDIAEFRQVFSVLRESGDVILLDQRGCGRSTPNLIPTSAERFGPEALVSRESFLAALVDASTAVKARVVAAGYDPRHFDIAHSVEDVEAVRRALGVPKIHVFAHSYGTQLAQAWIRAYPSSVERAILAGSRGMDTARKLPSQAEPFLDQIATRAREDITVGERFPNLRDTLTRVLARADREPIAVPVEAADTSVTTYRVGGYALRFILARFYLNDPDNGRFLPKLLDEIDTGRRPWSLTFNVLQLLRSPVSLTWFTTDAATGVSAARARRIEDEAKSATLGDAMNFPFPDINRVWNMRDGGEALREAVRSEVRALFLVGDADGITPVSQTREIMAGFPHARLLVVENAGHISMFRAPRVPAALRSFLEGGVPIERDRIDPTPFVPLITERKN